VEFDYVVIGAGSAGCAVAARLSEAGDATVGLLEAGGRDSNPWIHIPVGYFKTMNSSLDWKYMTEPDPGLNGRRLPWPRGKVLGGSSSLNGLLYVRGQAQDYDGWRQSGNTGWGWDDVLPYFRRSEKQERGEDAYHGADGPLSVSNMRLKRRICDEWVEAAQKAGYAYNDDYNGATQEGVGYFQLTAANGVRCSSATAYLKPARKRKNLDVITKAHVKRIVFDADKRATGVEILRGGKTEIIRARSEIILCAGALGSPQILMLSGIGPGDHLSDMNIGTVHEAAAVGTNLQDHLQARLIYKCTRPTMNNEVRSLFGKMKIAAEYALRRSGPMTMAASLAVGFMKTRPELATPDIQFHIQPWSADSTSEGVHPFSAFTASVCQLRPESAGHLLLDPENPLGAPKIHPNYLATPLDCATAVAGVKVAQKIAGFEPLKAAITEELRPGPDRTTDDDLLQWVRDTASSIYHPTGTCRMGQDDGAVVDERLRVRGVTGLRVADCSIMPKIVSGNTNAPAIMIGEKLSDMVREDARQNKNRLAGAA